MLDLLKEKGFKDNFFENKINFLLGISENTSQKIVDNNLFNIPLEIINWCLFLTIFILFALLISSFDKNSLKSSELNKSKFIRKTWTRFVERLKLLL